MIFGWIDLLYIFGHGGVRLGARARRHQVQSRRAATTCRATAPRSTARNHQSNVDPPVLFTRSIRGCTSSTSTRSTSIPVLARAFRMGGFIPIDRRNKEAALRSIETGAASLRAGNSFLIFPEGTRSKTDELLPFKKGGFIMAIKAGAPIVPVAISGGRAAMVKGSAIIRPVTLTVRIGTPVETKGVDVEDRDALIARVRQEIATLLAQGPL